MKPLLSVHDLAYGIAGRTLARGLRFELHAGNLLHVSGPNGSGKSTLIKVLQGNHPKRSGRIRIRVARDKIEVLPQLQNLHFHFPVTLRDVLEIALPFRFDEEQAMSFGLLEKRHLALAWNTASGGERKRTLLTRALLRSPNLIFLDEPLNHLDEGSSALVVRAMKKFLGQADRAAVWISHSGDLEHELGKLAVKRIELGESR